jgi:hypothetical protein
MDFDYDISGAIFCLAKNWNMSENGLDRFFVNSALTSERSNWQFKVERAFVVLEETPHDGSYYYLVWRHDTTGKWHISGGNEGGYWVENIHTSDIPWMKGLVEFLKNRL